MTIANKRKYIVEMRASNEVRFDKWIVDYIEAETEEEALELAFAWLKEHGYDGEISEIEFQVSECI